MMDIVFATATQLAQMIRNKEVSAIEVLDAYLQQIDRYNGSINAIANTISSVIGNEQHPRL